MRRIAALMAECEDSSTSDDIAEARRAYLEKLTKAKDAIIKVVPRTDASTKPLTGRWVDTVHDVGARKARWITRGYEQTLNGNEDFFSSTPAMMHLKMMLVDAALKRHVAAIGDRSGAFYQSPLNPDGTESKVWIEPPPEAELGPDCHNETRRYHVLLANTRPNSFSREDSSNLSVSSQEQALPVLFKIALCVSFQNNDTSPLF